MIDNKYINVLDMGMKELLQTKVYKDTQFKQLFED